MSRSLKKGPYVDARLIKKLQRFKPGDKTMLKTWARACTITPEMVGYMFGVHNGKTHSPVSIVENMVGHKLGEFSPTRKFVRHGGKMQRDIEGKQAEGAAAAPAPASAPAGKK